MRKMNAVRLLGIRLEQLCTGFCELMMHMFDRNRIEQVVCFNLCFDKAARNEDNANRAAGNDRPLAGSLEPFEKTIMCGWGQSFEF